MLNIIQYRLISETNFILLLLAEKSFFLQKLIISLEKCTPDKQFIHILILKLDILGS